MKLLAISCLFIGAHAMAASTSLDAIVAANYPASLTEAAANFGRTETREQAYVQITSARRKYVVAAYSNGAEREAAVRLLELSDSGEAKVDDTVTPLPGRTPEVSAADVDADGTAEAMITFEAARGTCESWIYKISDAHLSAISPTDKRGNSLLGCPYLLDVSGSGSLDILDKETNGRGDDATEKWHRYALKNGKYAETSAVDMTEIFYRDSGTPHGDTATFSVPSSVAGKSYRLTVVNGADSGKDYAVAAGRVSLNGATVVAPSDFSPVRRSWSVAVPVQQGDNVVTVQLDGIPRSRIAIVIEHE